jgi:hypothetical protein
MSATSRTPNFRTTKAAARRLSATFALPKTVLSPTGSRAALSVLLARAAIERDQRCVSNQAQRRLSENCNQNVNPFTLYT